MTKERALKYACIWLLNPMVATISTRGSSEGLLAVMVVALLWAVTRRRIVLAGMLLGLSVHLKIYPFIYGASIVWSLESPPDSTPVQKRSTAQTESSERLYSITTIFEFFNQSRTILIIS